MMSGFLIWCIWTIWGVCALASTVIIWDMFELNPRLETHNSKTGRTLFFAFAATYVVGLPVSYFL